jgi:hypothetical protein
MQKTVELFDAAGKLVHVGTVECVPDVIFFGVRAFYSPLPARGHYHEVSCTRMADDFPVIDSSIPLEELVT